MDAADHEEIRHVIDQVESGQLRAVPDAPWSVAWNLETFRTANGWQFRIFNDGGQWDYVDSVEAPDGAVLCHPDIDRFPEIADYAPKSIEVARNWGLSEEGARLLAENTFD